MAEEDPGENSTFYFESEQLALKGEHVNGFYWFYYIFKSDQDYLKAGFHFDEPCNKS